MNKLRSGFVVSALLALGACNVVHTTSQTFGYSPDYVNYAASAGSLPLVLTGNPLGSTTPADKNLLDHLNLPQWITIQKMHLSQGAEKLQGLRLVLAFNPASPTVDGDDLCAARPVETGPSDRLKALAALCVNDRRITSATAEGDVRQSLDNPAFIDLLNSLIAETLPNKKTRTRPGSI